MQFPLAIEDIDDDHKKLIETVNALYAAIHSGDKKSVVVDAFEEMKAYTDYHFGVLSSSLGLFTETSTMGRMLRVEHCLIFSSSG